MSCFWSFERVRKSISLRWAGDSDYYANLAPLYRLCGSSTFDVAAKIFCCTLP